MSKHIEPGALVITPDFSTFHIYGGPNKDGDRITYELAHRRVYCDAESVAPVEAITRYHEEAAKIYVRKDATQPTGSPYLWKGTLLTPTGHARMTVHAKTRKEARDRWARTQAILDWHEED